MSNIISKTNLVKRLSGIAFCALLLSFSTSPAGGEGFEIYLNNKVVLQQFGSNMDKIKTVSLEQAAPDDQLAIVYYHCGKQGKNRELIIKDEKGNTLKKWNFKDEGARMTCKVKDILGLHKENSSVLKLYYSSSELPEGRQLASINTGTKGVAKR